jgi:predicted CopG family antitoxin
MATMTITISDEVKAELEKYSWVNWTEAGREYFLKKTRNEEILARFGKALKNSEMTNEIAEIIGEESKRRIYKRIKGAR